jgi:hypothetical protein
VEAGVKWRPTLSSIERRTDRPQDRPRPVTETQRAETALPVAGLWDRCWCGAPDKHDWPGKDAGQPHPRTGEA